MHQHFQRLFNIVKKTGNNLVIFDQDSKDPYILMNLEEYEELLESYADPSPSAPAERREEVIVHSKPQKTEKVPLKQVSEAEAIPGIEAEVVDLGATQKETEPDQGEKYYFEAVEEGEVEGENGKNEKGDK